MSNVETPRQIAWQSQLARFVLSVDRQIKSSFSEKQDAEREADRIRTAFPKLLVSVSDSHESTLRESVAPPSEEG